MRPAALHRGGWCNANPVKHWVFDVTEAVERARAKAKDSGGETSCSVSVEYSAAITGYEGIPALGKVAEGAGAPAILMESYLVFSS
jgi:hypothetical protein